MSTYIALNRPPSETTDPEGWVNRTDIWLGTTTHTHMGDLHNYGSIQYEKPLPFEVVEKLEWTPISPVEWAHYQFYRAVNPGEDWQAFEDDYVTARKQNKLKESDRYYMPANIIYQYELRPKEECK